MTTLLAAFMLTGSVAQGQQRVQQFDEIDVHRINVREPDGTLRMVISNRARLPGVISSLSDNTATGNRRRVVIGPDKEGVAGISLMDRDGRRRISLQVTPDGTPSISFLDADGKVVNQLGPTPSP
jgi:hypothetical protein